MAFWLIIFAIGAVFVIRDWTEPTETFHYRKDNKPTPINPDAPGFWDETKED